MRWIIYGAGAIGGTIGARLHKAGENVVLIARGAHAQKIASDGLQFIHPLGNEFIDIPVVTHPNELASSSDDVILLCMKTQHTAGALADLCALGLQDLPVFCVQNGVENERLASRLFSHVYATVVNLPAMHLEPGVVATYAGSADSQDAGLGGVLDSGCYPGGIDEVAERVCAGLRKAGFAANADARVMAQKYAKLLSNLSNVLELVLAERDDFRVAGRDLRAEAQRCYDAANIDYVPLRDYVTRNSERYTVVDLADTPRAGGSTLQSLQRGAPEVETDYLNGEIALLGRLHGVATPFNSVLQSLAREIIQGRREPRSLRWSELSSAT